MSKREKSKQEKNRQEKSRKQPPLAARVARATVTVTADTVSGVIMTVFKIVGSVVLCLLLAGLMFAIIFAYYVKTSLAPTLSVSLEDYQLCESGAIYYQDSTGIWQELAQLPADQNRIWVDYEEFPWYLEKAVVAIEDKRFYEHKGVDWYRTAGAFVHMFAQMDNNFGGSTVTQQLIKNLTGHDDVTVQRKLAEIFSALELEKKYDKQEIMEWYLNAVYFGEGCYGVQTAAHTYFGKDIQDLTLAQAAAIVGITNQPTRYDPFYDEQANKERQETILHEMYDQGYIDYDTYIAAVNEDIASTFVRSPGETRQQVIYSYYTEVVISDVINDLMTEKQISRETARYLLYNGGYHVYCCLDPNIQAIVDSVYEDPEQIPYTWGSNQQLQSSIVIMEPYTGKIVALSGGVGEKNANFALNRVYSQRAPGSSFKAISAYGPAVELLGMTPNTLVDDDEKMHLSGTSWYPHNDSYQHMGVITILDALTNSLNTVAAQIVDKLGPETCYNYLIDKLGVTSLVPDDASYAPMALGQLTNGITTREMAQAYSSFVNDGIFTYARTYTLVTDSYGGVVLDNQPRTIVAFSPNTAHVMTYMLQCAAKWGTGYEAWIGNMPVAGKTGTSESSYDRWFVGVSPYYTCAIWTGYDMPERINVNGNPASQLFKKIMTPIHEGLAWRDFAWPYIGGDNYMFGDLHEKLKEQEEEKERKRKEEEEKKKGQNAAEAAENAVPELVWTEPEP
ncbi:MAG: transglycosylase domain-containing protein [Oscillospiraceae bacterium]|nr:transglycosylase domain-containing protein [Oscillospiraceae bacterium]